MVLKTSYTKSRTTFSHRRMLGANLRCTVSTRLHKFGVQSTINALKYWIWEMCKYDLFKDKCTKKMPSGA